MRFKKLWQKISEPEYRTAFRSARVRNYVAYQIRALRERRGWSQKQLAEIMQTKQSTISRLENAANEGYSMSQLLKVADALDVGLTVKFVAFSDMVADTDKLAMADMIVPTFPEEADKSTYTRVLDPLGRQQHLIGITAVEGRPTISINVTKYGHVVPNTIVH